MMMMMMIDVLPALMPVCWSTYGHYAAANKMLGAGGGRQRVFFGADGEQLWAGQAGLHPTGPGPPMPAGQWGAGRCNLQGHPAFREPELAAALR